MGKIKFFEVVKEKIGNIRLDSTNPNELPDLKMKGLRETIKRFGFLEPIVVNKDNVMIDGEHRFRILKEMGEKEIPVIRIDVNKIDHKVIRQTMNKLRGTHNPRDDIEDLLRISKEVSVQDMSRYLGLEEKNLADYLESINQVPESYLSLLIEEKARTRRLKFINIKLTDEQAKKLLDEMEGASLKDIVLVPVSGMLVDNVGK